MGNETAFNIDDASTKQLVRDLAELRDMVSRPHRAMLAKAALENLSVMEARGHSNAHTIAQLRASVLRELIS